jgi:hypothetical protein
MLDYLFPLLGALAVLALAAAAAVGWVLYRKHVFDWLPGWLAAPRAAAPAAGPVHVLFCFVDHYEPRWGNADPATETRRVKTWVERYPQLCAGLRDADGCAPKHSFFYPSEEYRPEHLDALVGLCREGYGEIEIHLHHDNDTEAGLRTNLADFLKILDERHGAVPRTADGRLHWAFVHGNWALDNSRPDGRWCGVNNEISVLADMGCYADFTLPSAPDQTQTRTVNQIYYAKDDACAKSHDRGERVRVGGRQGDADLMIIQGPLGLRWKRVKGLPVPSIENSDVRANFPPVPARVDFWVEQGIHVEGRPEWVFVKVHTHGTQERDIDALLGAPVREMFEHLQARYNDGKRYQLHYVSAREMYNIARAAEAGHAGAPGAYRDFEVPRPPFLAGVGA